MRWAAIATPDLKQDVILFDGDCVLCSHWARFVHRHDTAHRFKFTAIQSAFGQALAERFSINARNPETNVAVIDGCAYFKSDTPLAILAALPGWRWAAFLRVVPRGLRNWIYDHIARSRYQLFGRHEQCWVADPSFKSRILENAP
jgi:predicted DCC family thiol-disulfide oxidoreductase YuxK